MLRSLLLGSVVAALPILSAAAAPATPEEASRLQAVFERYVGRPSAGEAPRATVTPQGDDYAATVDLKRALSGLDAFGASIDPYTVRMILTPQADGTWRVRSGDTAPLVVRVGDQTITLAAKTSAFDGTFDPRLESFSAFKEDQTGAGDTRLSPGVVQSRAFDTVALSGTGTAAANGTVTTASRSATTGVSGEIMLKPDAPPSLPPTNPAVPPPSQAGTDFTFKAAATRNDSTVDRLDAAKALDLWAFLAAHPSRDAVVAAQDDLKGLLRAGLPYLQGATQAVTIEAPSVGTPVGTVTARSAGFSVEASGLGGTGRAALAVTAADLAVPLGQLPPWSATLVPTGLDLHAAFEGIHATEAAKALVDDVDLRNSVIITPEQKAAVGHLFWPGGTVTLGASRVTTKVLDVAFEGRATLGPPTSGQVTVTAKGLDKEIAALQALAAKDPGAGQVLGPLALAKGLAKPNPDGSLVWVIAFGNGPLTVNGAPLQ